MAGQFGRFTRPVQTGFGGVSRGTAPGSMGGSLDRMMRPPAPGAPGQLGQPGQPEQQPHPWAPATFPGQQPPTGAPAPGPVASPFVRPQMSQQMPPQMPPQMPGKEMMGAAPLDAPVPGAPPAMGGISEAAPGPFPPMQRQSMDAFQMMQRRPARGMFGGF